MLRAVHVRQREQGELRLEQRADGHGLGVEQSSEPGRRLLLRGGGDVRRRGLLRGPAQGSRQGRRAAGRAPRRALARRGDPHAVRRHQPLQPGPERVRARQPVHRDPPHRRPAP
ncbi:hypothetical protein FOCC_FOCC013092, partial [Frankliniella occidentalis]